MAADEVFTPRSPAVNKNMYISRVEQELAILNQLTVDKNLIIHGESGTGKSWLFKQTFDRFSIKYAVVNMANAARMGDLNEAFEAKFNSLKNEFLKSRQEGGSTEVLT